MNIRGLNIGRVRPKKLQKGIIELDKGDSGRNSKTSWSGMKWLARRDSGGSQVDVSSFFKEFQFLNCVLLKDRLLVV